MRSVVNLVKRLKTDEDGASLIEYTVLLGILLVAVIAIIGAVGGWINNQWSCLKQRHLVMKIRQTRYKRRKTRQNCCQIRFHPLA